MITAAQARRLGISRVDLSRLVGDGTLEAVAGAARVYRLTGVPEDADVDAVRAAWLQLGGSRTWEERRGDVDAVVSHRSAAHVRGLGDLIPRTHDFYVPVRRRLRRGDVRLRVRADLAAVQWGMWAGLPVCTIERIVTDLVADHEDESAVAQVIRDALRDGLLSREAVRRAVEDHAGDYGHRTADAMVAVLTGDEE
jgi:hypothetical protein